MQESLLTPQKRRHLVTVRERDAIERFQRYKPDKQPSRQVIKKNKGTLPILNSSSQYNEIVDFSQRNMSSEPQMREKYTQNLPQDNQDLLESHEDILPNKKTHSTVKNYFRYPRSPDNVQKSNLNMNSRMCSTAFPTALSKDSSQEKPT